MRTIRILLDPEAGEGGRSTTTEAEGGRSAESLAAFNKLLARKDGDATALAMQLHAEVLDERRQAASYKAKLPPEGSLVLTGDDVSLWSAYRDLGKPEDIRRSLKDGVTEREELGTFRREKALSAIGKKAGVEAIPAFIKIAEEPDRYVEKTEKKDGKDVVSVFVKDGDAEIPFDEYHAEFLPSLRPAKAPEPKGTPRRDAQTKPTVLAAEQQPQVRSLSLVR